MFFLTHGRGAQQEEPDPRTARQGLVGVWPQWKYPVGYVSPMNCPACGGENRDGRKFCAICGASLGWSCAACGAPNEPGERFCGQCGAAAADAPAERGVAPADERGSERRIVSVLFVDLVGFTPLSERLDAEDVREILGRYFDNCRRIVDRYGGVIEKFIGDAVMAVWGSPVAHEDDAERAVRAAIELVAAVTALGVDVGEEGLRARAGVLTGEAAVTSGSTSEGMVVGDLVNTASRLQSIAEPGAVVVGDSTRRATESSISYEDNGARELKGKAEPMQTWRALQVTAGRRGAMKSAGLEAPFVGRDREFRLLKDLFHATSEEERPHLVSVVGTAGIGKSRLSWEFEKYIDGLVQNVLWHRGRCLSYGEGVTYWALAEMVKSRAGITEEDDTSSAATKLHAAVVLYVQELDEQRWIEQRLAQLLGLEDRISTDREDLFAGWRLFFERLAETSPVAMVFEDLQWADAAMLDFIGYLLDWSKDHAMFVLTLARPEFIERRPGWGSGQRGFTSLFLEPLRDGAMDELLHGLVPGLPEDLRAQIRARAEGVPLYAVETVRMLLDRGSLTRVGDSYQPAGPITALDVPETLHALIAARLDALDPAQRKLLQTASVLGKAFTSAGVVALSGLSGEEVAETLGALTRKEFLEVQQDPRSPERGQYEFMQAMMKTIAYETLAKKDRKTLHLAAARYLEEAWGEENEIVEVLAAHYLDAHALFPDAPDAEEIKERAKDCLERAGQRAASLFAGEEAQRYLERAAELSHDELERAGLLERAGMMARQIAHHPEAMALLERAHAIFIGQGATHQAARVSARIGELEWLDDKIEESLERLERAYDVIRDDEPDEDLASLAHTLGRIKYFAGDLDGAAPAVDAGLQIAERLESFEVLSHALNTKGLIVEARGGYQEALALQRHALALALERELPLAALRAYFNLAYQTFQNGRFSEADEIDRGGLALARRIGHREWEWNFIAHLVFGRYIAGDWDGVEELPRDFPTPDEAAAARFAWSAIRGPLAYVRIARGDLEGAWYPLHFFEGAERSTDFQERTTFAAALAHLRLAEGRFEEALALGELAFEIRTMAHKTTVDNIQGFYAMVEAALTLGRLEKAEELVDTALALPPVTRGKILDAHAKSFAARIAALRGRPEEAGFLAAEATFREVGPFWLARTLLDHGEMLVKTGRPDDAEPLLSEAREIFERLEAKPFLDRISRIAGVPA